MEGVESSELNSGDEKLGSNDEQESFIANVFWFIDLIALFAVIVVLMNTFFYRSMHVEGDSMQPTFQPKDSVGISDFFYKPKNFDVVIINTVDLIGKTIIKRIIALPGQEVFIDDDGNVWVDGVKLVENYLGKGIKTPRNNWTNKPSVVPKGYFFALGDNRPNSSDSRDFGLFKFDQIVGPVLFRWWPFNKFKTFF